MKEILSLIMTCLFLIILTGCATNLNFKGNDTYSKEIIPNQKTRITSVWVEDSAGEFTVSGRIRLKGLGQINTPDYVQVDLIDGTGQKIDSQKVAYYPRNLRRSQHAHEGKFAANFSEAPPPGTVIRLSNVN